MPKLLFVALDGASHRVAERLNLFPALEKGLLWSIPAEDDQPHTGPSFASMYTGLLPEEHGITQGGWLISHKNWTHLQALTIWEQLPSVGLMTLPITWPVKRINGWMISGFPAPDNARACFYPAELREGFGGVTVDYLNGDRAVSPKHPELVEHPDILKGLAQARVGYCLELVKRYPVEVVAIGFTLLDRIQHQVPQDHPAIGELYRFAASLVGDLIELLRPEKVLIASDHGFHPTSTWHDREGLWASNYVEPGPHSILDIYSYIEEAVNGNR